MKQQGMAPAVPDGLSVVLCSALIITINDMWICTTSLVEMRIGHLVGTV